MTTTIEAGEKCAFEPPGLSMPPLDMEEESRDSKRMRDAQMEQEMAEDEENARGTERPDIELVTVVGPPWWDEYTGLQLDDKKTEIAMQSEKASFDRFHAMDDYPEEDIGNQKVIPMRWLLHDRPMKGIKARMVVQDINRGGHQDTFAASPTTLGQRLLMRMSVVNGWGLVVGDVSTAFLHAPLPEGSVVLVEPPPSLKKKGYVWKLNKAVYGLRQAPRLFQEFLARELEKVGWMRLLADPQFFVHPDGAMLSIHADDLLLAAACADMEKFQKQISEHMVIKWGDHFTNETWVKYLGREWCVVPHGIAVRLPSRYYDKLLDLMFMKDCKAIATPGAISACPPEQAAQALSPEEVSRYRSVVGKIMWMLPERPDLSFSAKELARHVQAPTVGDYKSLKHLVRYIKGAKEYVRLRSGG